ncbi:MAG: ATP-binding protein [Candidatus Odinarchaeota archaeon]
MSMVPLDEKFQALVLDNISDAVIIMEHDFTIIYWNKSAERMFGWKMSEVINKRITDVIPASFTDFSLDDIIARFYQDGQWSGESYHHHKDGHRILTYNTGKVARDEETGRQYVITVLRDLTEAKKAEERLKESEQYTKLIIDSISDGIAVFDLNGDIVLRNNAFIDLYKRFFGKGPEHCSSCPLKDTHVFCKTIRKFLHSDEPLSETIEVKKGQFIQVTLPPPVLSGFGGKGTIIEVRDVTAQVAFEKMRTQFISTVSHELRTPATGINLSTSNLLNYWDKLAQEEKKKLLSMIADSSTTLITIIDDLLLLSRIEHQKLVLTVQPVSLLKLVTSVMRQFTSRLIEKKSLICTGVPEEIHVNCDSERLGQVLRILVDNALKYSPSDTTVTINAVDNYIHHASGFNTVGTLISVTDQGFGIKEEDKEHLFEQFYRSKDVAGIKGTGLGLSIAMKLVELHGGTILVESTHGKGSTFSVFLPEKTDVKTTGSKIGSIP